VDNVFGRASAVAGWPAVALLFATYALCDIGFGLRAKALAACTKVPDATWGYTSQELHTLLASYGPPGRNLYAVTEWTLDLVFMLAYTGLFAAFLARLYSKPAARRLVVVPLLGLAADLAENAQLAYFAWTFQDDVTADSSVASLTTRVKMILFALSFHLVIAGALGALCCARRGSCINVFRAPH
jgi:hypothetical protein